jgi:hypothetical protein
MHPQKLSFQPDGGCSQKPQDPSEVVPVPLLTLMLVTLEEVLLMPGTSN